jgi:hypothetical protein
MCRMIGTLPVTARLLVDHLATRFSQAPGEASPAT